MSPFYLVVSQGNSCDAMDIKAYVAKKVNSGAIFSTMPKFNSYMTKKLIKKSVAKAIFLDRDGTIVRHVDLLHQVSGLRLLPNSARAIQAFNRLGYLVVVITNQPVVARGIATFEDVEKVHASMIRRFAREGARIDTIYFCPHHPEKHPGVPEHARKYRMVCACRKPKPGMLKQATKEYKIDPKKSFTIGDSMIDIVAGKRAGTRTILVKTGPGHRLDAKFAHIKPDHVARNLLSAADFIKKNT